jgi:hypothetical protein
MSEYNRRTGVKKLRVRGLKAVSYAAIMKAIGLNIRRAVATKMWQKAAEMPCFGQICVLICLIVHLTEQISAQFDKFASWIRQNRSDLPADLKIAA